MTASAMRSSGMAGAITHDPLRLSWGGKDLYVNLGAERLLAAEKWGSALPWRDQELRG